MGDEGMAIPEGTYLTLKEAAARMGYSPKATGNLRTAIAEGRLRALKVGKRSYLTTQEWLDTYAATLKRNRTGRPRRQPPEEEPQ